MHKEEFEDRDLFLAKFGTISTEDQVKELQEILRTYYNLLRCLIVNALEALLSCVYLFIRDITARCSIKHNLDVEWP